VLKNGTSASEPSNGNGGSTNQVSIHAALALFEETIPVPAGATVLASAAGRPTMLVVDDKSDDVCKMLANAVIPITQGIRLENLFHFEPYALQTDDRQPFEEALKGIKAALRQHFKPEDSAVSKHHYVAVLLDIDFQAADGRLGVAEELIKEIRLYSPAVKILIHTSFGRDRYIVRSIAGGADWYCRKDQPHRLLRNILSLQMPKRAPSMVEDYNDALRIQPHWEGAEVPLAHLLERDLEESSNNSARIKVFSCIRELLDDLPGSILYAMKLSGGLSGALTLKVFRRCEDQRGPGGAQLMSLNDGPAPMVVKVGRYHPMLDEYLRYKKFMRPYIDNNVGRIDKQAVQADWKFGAIAYSYAGERQGAKLVHSIAEARSIREVLKTNLAQADHLIRPFEDYQPVLDKLFYEILPRIHRIKQQVHRHSYTDYPNQYFEEYPNSTQAYQIRLPASIVLHTTLVTEFSPPPSFRATTRSPRSDAASDLWRTMATNGSIHEIDFDERGARSKEKNYGKLVRFRGIIRGISQTSLYVVPELQQWAKDCEGRALPAPQIKLEGPLVEHLIEHCSVRSLQIIDVEGYVKKWRSDQWEKPRFRGKLPNKIHRDMKGDAMHPAVIAELFETLLQDEGRTGSSEYMQNTLGVIHGDLNLDNILLECLPGGMLMPSGASPWLIDFSRTRRASIAVDFAEFESVLGCMLLKPEDFTRTSNSHREDNVENILNFFRAVNNSPWRTTEPARKSRKMEFVFDAMYYMRRVVARAGLHDDHYMAHLALANLVSLKVFGNKDSSAWRDAALLAYLAANVAVETIYKHK
jgi:hypothetical protein